MVEQGQRGDASEASAVVGLVVQDGLTAAQAQRLHAAADGRDARGLQALVALLRNVDTWPLRHPELARRFMSKARDLGADAAEVRAEVVGAMNIGAWGFVDGESQELESARATAMACVEAETDPELREEFQAALTRIEHTVDWLRRQNAEEDEAE